MELQLHFTYKPKGKNKGFYVCSRNVCFDTPEKAEKCYYDTNVYLEMAYKYDIENVLKDLMKKFPDKEFITLQGETYGDGIQKRDYGLKDGEHDFKAFNLIVGIDINNQQRMNTLDMKDTLEKYNVPVVPILDTMFLIPETCDNLLSYADGKSQLDGEMREGVVLRTYDGESSFKAVSNDFLIKYHNGD